MCSVLCKYFMNGACAFGDQCRFSHNRHDEPTQVKSQWAALFKQAASLSLQPLIVMSRAARACRKPLHTSHSTLISCYLSVLLIPQVCKYYLAGNCAYGDRCRYMHSKPSWSSRGQPAPPRYLHPSHHTHSSAMCASPVSSHACLTCLSLPIEHNFASLLVDEQFVSVLCVQQLHSSDWSVQALNRP